LCHGSFPDQRPFFCGTLAHVGCGAVAADIAKNFGSPAQWPLEAHQATTMLLLVGFLVRLEAIVRWWAL
jgi:hypothetical protein